MQLSQIFSKAINFAKISKKEAVFLYQKASLSELMLCANTIRNNINHGSYVSYIIDRNINYTNVCFSKCLFCNFCKSLKDENSYSLHTKDLIPKIEELLQNDGEQILLQGGMNPTLGLSYYTNLFSELKSRFPQLKLHALSPTEIIFLTKKEKLSIEQILHELRNAGLDSLPGGGAEILSDRVRKRISPLKCSVKEWSEVMIIAHEHNITTSATMMFGHLETIEERMEHLCLLRNIQTKKTSNSTGFISFTLWPLASKDTTLIKKYPEIKPIHPEEYIRMLAVSRIVLNNIQNIQASWLTVGKEVAGVCLFAGANDLSSIMIEENVLSSAGKHYKMDEKSMISLISSLGFKPAKRNQEYEYIDFPKDN